MTATETSAPSNSPASTATASVQAPTVTPNQFHLQGSGLRVSYYPEGVGPVRPSGSLVLTYQDAHRSISFTNSEVRVVRVADLGTIVSTTLVETVDIGRTTFSLLVPDVALPHPGSSAPVQTEGITTVERTSLVVGALQQQSYTVSALDGTAADGMLPY